MADATLKVEIDAVLSEKLTEKLNEAKALANQVNMSKTDRKSYNASLFRAERALENKDVRDFRENFNALIKTLERSVADTGKVDKGLEKLVKEIDYWTETVKKKEKEFQDRTTIAAKAQGRSEFLKQYTENNKPITHLNGKNFSAAEIEKYLNESWNNLFKEVNGNIKAVTDKQAQNFGFKDRYSVQRMNKVAGALTDYDNADAAKDAALEREIHEAKEKVNSLTQDLELLKTASIDSGDAVNQLYNQLHTLGAETRSTVDQAIKDATPKKEKDAGLNLGVDKSALKDTSDLSSENFTKTNNSLGKLVKNITVYHLALRAVRTVLRSTVHTIKELDKQLTEQAMVTGRTRKETYALLKEYQQLAITLGATTKEVAQVTTEYMRQGKTAAESIKLAEAAISAAKVASINTSDSVNYLTTALNGFRLSSEDAMKVSDKFAAIAASAAVSYEEIATALSKVAAQANLAGMSIDYTTAILAKGIETTREAPETIGTALKTVIARMREIKDYGETLGGDTDLNNVENQLAYVGIELKNNNGELRSTEDVLDDLGKKWDSLNSNQQAAIAKALAGTRQQSRLISMMTDYERVIELQEIAERSQGATMAQMATYTEGMEAAMNKVAVSWEKIVTTVTNSDVIIGIVNAFANILNMVNDILSNDIVLVGILITIGTLLVAHYGTKVKQRLESYKDLQIQKQLHLAELKSLKISKQKEISKLKILKSTLEEKKAEGNISAAEQQRLITIDAEIKASERALEVTNNEITGLEKSETLVGNISTGFENIAYGIMGMVAPLAMVITSFLRILGLKKAAQVVDKQETEEQKKQIALNKVQTGQEREKAAYGMAKSASAIPVAGWVIAAGILAALIGVTLAVAIGNFSSSTEKTSDKVDDLSNEIYKLQKTKTALDTVISKFDAIDEKIIKTSDDLKTMNELLDQAADSLSTDKKDTVLDFVKKSGKTEKEYYDSLQTAQAKRDFLEKESQALQKKLKEDRDKQLQIIASVSAATRKELLTNEKYLNVQDAVYSLNNATLNDYIELQEKSGKVTTEQASNIRKFTQALLESVSAEEAWRYAQHPEQIKALTKSLQELRIEVDNSMVNSIDVLGNSTYSLKAQIQAYKDIAAAIHDDKAAYQAFVQEYSAFDVYLQLSDSAIEFIEKANISVEKLNDIYTAYHKLQNAGIEITKEDFQGRFATFLENLAAFENDATAAINATFADILAASENQAETFKILINTFSSIIETGLLNMGQNITTFKNTVNAFYEKAKNWTTMSDSDKSAFIADYNDLFSDVAGEKLAQALESGNYAAMEQALKDNQTFQKQRVRLLQQVEEELKWELAKEGDAYNAAYIQQLEQTKAFLSDMDKVFKADLNWRLEQEQKALDAYKNLLQQRADEETKRLEERKQAYQDYFDEVKEAREDEDYEEQASLLISNISKLGASTNADAVKQAQDLQEQLEELEKERLQELQDRAQEQILQNLDDEINKISTQLEDIINNQQALLVAMNEQMSNPSQFISDLLSNKISTEGLTQLGFQDYMNTLKETFASFMEFDWDALNGNVENNNSNSLILNVNGGTYELDQEQQNSLFDTILNALQQMGIR